MSGDQSNIDKDEVIKGLKAEIGNLEERLKTTVLDLTGTYYSSSTALKPSETSSRIPKYGTTARFAKERIVTLEQLDFKPMLNTSSYVNVVMEPEEIDCAVLGMKTNIADASVYPSSVKIHDMVVNMLARLWNCPEPTEGDNFSGAGTVGSTEACLLAGLAMKFRWRKWYGKKFNLNEREVMGVRPNLVISTCFQAAWEKFFRYFDVDPKFVVPSCENKFRLCAEDVIKEIDEKTIGVVGILGNHYNGAYDPIWEFDTAIQELNASKGFQIGIHVDGASGGFIAPFQEDMPPFDFRLESVISMSASGHKFGESVCGTGWIIFRRREDLAEHIAISVSYLGGHCDSMTLNFSRPASGIYCQYFKFLRFGITGYTNKVNNQMKIAAYLRSQILAMKDPNSGLPIFLSLDCGDTHCLPVFAARLNPEVTLSQFNDIDVQHALYESHWYVSGYALSMEDFTQDKLVPFTSDAGIHATMLRVVVKSNLTYNLAEDLICHMREAVRSLMEDQLHRNFVERKKMKSSIKKVMTDVGGSKKVVFAYGHTQC